MTHEEEEQLRQMGADLAGAVQSPWQPRCIARAFAWKAPEALRFTMQSWIDLENVRSPLLQGQLPESIEDLESALRACGWRHELAVTPEDAVGLAVRLRDMILEAFELALPMRPTGEPAPTSGIDGFGAWAPLMACLISQMGMALPEALSIDVGQAYVLVAAHRRNQGWEVAGVPYALRDVEETQPSRTE